MTTSVIISYQTFSAHSVQVNIEKEPKSAKECNISKTHMPFQEDSHDSEFRWF